MNRTVARMSKAITGFKMAGDITDARVIAMVKEAEDELQVHIVLIHQSSDELETLKNNGIGPEKTNNEKSIGPGWSSKKIIYRVS